MYCYRTITRALGLTPRLPYWVGIYQSDATSENWFWTSGLAARSDDATLWGNSLLDVQAFAQDCAYAWFTSSRPDGYFAKAASCHGALLWAICEKPI